mmetsp:Transcript_13485/g.31732  ORF Transcript_13485/g.31732 Transcript_13485/m.31732 type:complete len:109 (+) Transcript_13485:187-513(+)
MWVATGKKVFNSEQRSEKLASCARIHLCGRCSNSDSQRKDALTVIHLGCKQTLITMSLLSNNFRYFLGRKLFTGGFSMIFIANFIRWPLGFFFFLIFYVGTSDYTSDL